MKRLMIAVVSAVVLTATLAPFVQARPSFTTPTCPTEGPCTGAGH